MSKMALSNLSTVISYILHGFNQSSNMLKDMCDSLVQNIICIIIQENLLTNENLHKPNIFDGYTFYGCSAMDEVVSKPVLKGRPFGVVGILIKVTYVLESLITCAPRDFRL